MLKMLRPDECRKSVLDIDLNRLWEQGIRGIILDLDNTLVEFDKDEVAPTMRAWVDQARERGFQLYIASNSLQRRVVDLSALLGLPAISKAAKPRRKAFRQALQAMGLRADQAAVAGDQLFTDILGGNRLGMHTILINPMSPVEWGHTRLARRLEDRVITRMLHRGMITPGDWETRVGRPRRRKRERLE